MNKAWLYNGDCLEIMRGFPSQSIHCCVTSPPYFGLRDYGVEGQIGLEPTIEAYVERLVEVFREVRRVLRDDGTFWLNLGDSYAGSSMTGGVGKGTIHGSQQGNRKGSDLRFKVGRDAGVRPKNLIGMPWRVAFALQTDGWILRSDIIWAKANPMPESVTDRPTRCHEYIFLLTKSPRYFYDSEAIKEEGVIKAGTKGAKGSKERSEMPGVNSRPPEYKVYDGMRSKRSVWNVNTRPYKGAHFATFPPALVEPCILAGTSERGCCPQCDTGWRRVVERTVSQSLQKSYSGATNGAVRSHRGTVERPGMFVGGEARTTGWQPGCPCGSEKTEPCVVMDPFAGSGTVGEVSLKYGRNAVLIELNPQYCELIEQRCGEDNVVRVRK